MRKSRGGLGLRSSPLRWPSFAPAGSCGGLLRSRRRFAPASEGGFTLLEVLLALVIVVAGIAIVAQGFYGGTRSAARARSETTAMMLAERKMGDLETGENSLARSESGTFSDAEEYRYQVDIEPDSSTSGLYKITVTVSFGEGGEERSVALHRLMRERPTPP